MVQRICSIGDCESSVHGRAMCLKHYRRWQRHGNAETVFVVRYGGDTMQRFWSKVDKTGKCWNWTAAVDLNGYGKFYHDRKLLSAHRFSYQIATGEDIPDGMHIDHRCHNKACVNPDHLRLATPSQNSQNYPPTPIVAPSGVRGVSWSPKRRMWRARVQHKRKCVYCELFPTLDEAAAAVLEARRRIHTHNDLDHMPTKNPLGTTAGAYTADLSSRQ